MAKTMKLTRALAIFFALLLCIPFSLGAQGGQTLYVTPDVVSTSPPNYPPIARTAHISGTVNIDVMVSKDGSVASAKAIDGHPILRSVSETSALKWRFAPAEGNSEVRLVRLTFTFRFLTEGVPESELQPVFVTAYHIEIIQNPPAPTMDFAPILGKKRTRKSKFRKSNCKYRRCRK